MNAVLISIQPKWCELIASGKKTVEVRKTKPKIETPFKVYIYCTYGEGLIEANDEFLPNHLIEQKVSKNKTWGNCCNGKVIGEFVCDKIFTIQYSCGSYRCDGLTMIENDRVAAASQLSLYDMRNYLLCNGGYAWHISDLVIYDKPKELSEFNYPPYCDCDIECRRCKYGFVVNTILGDEFDCDRSVKRPPQSWCYVEEYK